jgi:hypothetical protein
MCPRASLDDMVKRKISFFHRKSNHGRSTRLYVAYSYCLSNFVMLAPSVSAMWAPFWILQSYSLHFPCQLCECPPTQCLVNFTSILLHYLWVNSASSGGDSRGWVFQKWGRINERGGICLDTPIWRSWPEEGVNPLRDRTAYIQCTSRRRRRRLLRVRLTVTFNILSLAWVTTYGVLDW